MCVPSKRAGVLALALLTVVPVAPQSRAEDPWADEVVAVAAINPNVGFDTPEKTLGPPSGGGSFAPDNSSLHSLGSVGSFLTLRFDTPVTDDPANPFGLDCIVYGNPFWVGGDPQRKFVEPALIEISRDDNGNGIADDPWYVIPGSRNLSQSIRATGIPQPTPPLAGSVLNPNSPSLDEFDWGYAELNPTQRPYLDNYVRPDDPFAVGLSPRSGGGDAFDIAWAVDGTGDAAGITEFHFVRLWTLVDENTGFGIATAEIDAVADVAPAVDLDEDGILDEYETRVAGTDPSRPESTVLALEVPPEDGGSPTGTILGTAADALGNGITLVSSGPRGGVRAFNVTVDILPGSDPGGTISGLERSTVYVAFQTSVSDFVTQQIAPAQFAIAYAIPEIQGLAEDQLVPFRWNGSVWSNTGIGGVAIDTNAGIVVFESPQPGLFTLAAPAGDAGLAGDPVGPIEISNLDPDAIAPGPIGFATSPLLDAEGLVLENGRSVTVTVTGGTLAQADADTNATGEQVLVTGGIASFLVLVDVDAKATTTPLQISVFADPAQTQVLGTEIFAIALPGGDSEPLPLSWVGISALALALAGLRAHVRGRR